MSIINNESVTRWVNNCGLFMSVEEAAQEGRFWVVKIKGEALITTAQTIEGVKVLSALGLTLHNYHVEQCDRCYGYSFSCAGQDDGPTDSFTGEKVAVVWYCYNCIDQGGK